MDSNYITIGRDPRSTIVVDERYRSVSNNHCDVEFSDGNYILYDHSSNGTFVNNRKVSMGHTTVYPGDNILLAGVYKLDWNEITPHFTRGRQTMVRVVDTFDSSARDVDGQKNDNLNNPYDNKSGNDSQSNVAVNAQNIEFQLSNWNWGAFYFGWIWGIFHKCYWPLILLAVTIFAYCMIWVPIFGLLLVSLCGIANFVAAIYLGIKGRRIAWDNGCFRDIEDLKETEHKWAIAALVVFLIGLFGSLIFCLTSFSLLYSIL